MLDLDSTRWHELASAGDKPSFVPQLIRKLMSQPSTADWAEVFEQIAHQWTLNPTAYAALPHLLRLGIEQGIVNQATFLLDLGRIAAPFERRAPCPDDLKLDFDNAIQEAAAIALNAARKISYGPKDYVCVLQAAAALNGRRGLWDQLFFMLASNNQEAELGTAPKCGAYLVGEILKTIAFELQVTDTRLKPRVRQGESPRHVTH